MSNLTILRDKNPEEAEFLERWESKYASRNYDFSKPEDQADFFEAVTEMARYIAEVHEVASVRAGASTFGISDVLVSTRPKVTIVN